MQSKNVQQFFRNKRWSWQLFRNLPIFFKEFHECLRFTTVSLSLFFVNVPAFHSRSDTARRRIFKRQKDSMRIFCYCLYPEKQRFVIFNFRALIFSEINKKKKERKTERKKERKRWLQEILVKPYSYLFLSSYKTDSLYVKYSLTPRVMKNFC